MKAAPVCQVLYMSISHLAAALGDEQGPDVKFSIVARIGVQEAKNKDEEPYQFAGIRSIDCDTAGNLYILDYKDVCVKVFDQSGRFMRRLSKSGEGPAVRIYNVGQPFIINDELFVLVTKQDFPAPTADWPTHPKKRVIDLYRLANDELKKFPGLPKTEFFLDYHTTWRNRLIISSSGYDLFPQIWILEMCPQ